MRREKSRRGLMLERPARGLKIRNLQTPANQRMKAFSESHPALTAWAGLILLFDGEVWRNATLPLRVKIGGQIALQPRRAQPNRYPDFGPGTSLPPSRSGGPVAVGVCNPLQWRNRPRFSRGSLTPGCGDDGQEAHRVSKNDRLSRHKADFANENLCLPSFRA